MQNVKRLEMVDVRNNEKPNTFCGGKMSSRLIGQKSLFRLAAYCKCKTYKIFLYILFHSRDTQ